VAAPADWSARRFSFDFEADVYPSVLMRLRGTAVRLFELTDSATPEQLTWRPAEGKWSALERIGHLFEVEELWTQRVIDFLNDAEELTPINHSLGLHEDYNAYAETGWGKVIAAFAMRRSALLEDCLDDLRLEHFNKVALHPRLKIPIRLVDHLYFAAEHDDHELAWIWELLRQSQHAR